MDTVFIRRLSISAILFFAVLVAGHIAVAATILWWDTGYLLRFNVAVTSGANVPDKGYVYYTARIVTLDTHALIAAGDLQGDCGELAMTYYACLKWLCRRWGPDGIHGLHNDLLGGRPAIESVAPIRPLARPQHLFHGRPHFRALLGETPHRATAHRIRARFPPECPSLPDRGRNPKVETL